MLIRAAEDDQRTMSMYSIRRPAGLAALERAGPRQFRSENHSQPGPADAGRCRMKTEFSLAQLADPDIAEADKILRACVHCGFCTATCPTYVLLGDELDSPRGRIYLIKEMLEKDQTPTAEVVKHVDRCLSCLACMTTCPSGVNYMHLVDQARVRIEQRYERPLAERLLRAVLAFVLPRPELFRASMSLARLARPLAAFLPSPRPSATPGLILRIKAMLALAPSRLPPPGPAAGSVFAALGKKRGRVALLQGCAQQVLAPRINQAAISLLTRHGIEVVLVRDEQCCGALTHHLGQRPGRVGAGARQRRGLARGSGRRRARRHPGDGVGLRHRHQGLRLHAARGPRFRRRCREGLSARQGHHRISSPASICGRRADTATSSSPITPRVRCSTDRKSRSLPKELLSKNGFVVKDVPESHLCCGSAGTYNILQPELAGRLRDRKVANIASVKPDMIAAGNIGCMVQIASGTSVPVVHTIELLDWATGGRPAARIELTRAELSSGGDG